MKIYLFSKKLWSIAILALLATTATFSQSIDKITGKVTDSNNQPLTGVSVVVKGTTNGTTTDATGQYTINVKPENILVFSFVGYTSREVLIKGKSLIDVSLEEDAAALDEVVVTGVFDKRTRLESSVAISTLTSKQLDRIVPNSGIDMLRNIPGVYVNSSKGEVSGSLNTRGLTIGDGFFYVSMQEDGLPILAAQGSSTTNPNYKPDGFYVQMQVSTELKQ